MMKIITILLCTFCFLVCTNSSHSQNSFEPDTRESITWLRPYFPPVTIPSGPDADSGYCDKIINFLIDHLPDYNHHFGTAHYQRILLQIRQEQEVNCSALYKDDERSQYVVFSIPALVVLPNGIVTRKVDRQLFAPYLNEAGELELTKLIQDKNLNLGIAYGRKYSGGIDEIIAAAYPRDNIQERPGEEIFKGLLDMLMHQRIDYTIGYPAEASYLASQEGYSDDISFFHIAETQGQITLGHLGCPNNHMGRKIIERVNKILREHRETPIFLGFYEAWLDDETVNLYRQLALAYFAEDDNSP